MNTSEGAKERGLTACTKKRVMEFTHRESKFEKEQKARREALKKKKADEERRKRAFEAKEAELESLRQQRRQEEETRKEVAENARLEEQALTGGVTFNIGGLTAYPIEGEDDKVILPEECLVDLSNLDVFGKGPVLLRLFKQDGKFTHVGIREFSAPAGMIGLPEKVVFTLTGGKTKEEIYDGCDEEDANAKSGALQANIDGALSVKYVTMPKVTYAKLQPLHNSFSQVKPVKDMLQENLRFHSTLSVGDLLTVWYRGVPHGLRVCEAQPQDFGSLIDTDVTIDLDVSQEYLDREKEKKMDEEQTGAKLQPQMLAPASAGSAPMIGEKMQDSAGRAATSGAGQILGRSSEGISEDPSEGAEGGEEAHTEHLRKYAILPEEPSQEDASALTARLRLSSGGAITRRLRSTEEVGYLLCLAARELSVGHVAVTLSTRFPARTITAGDATKTFADFGIGGGQETFFVTVG